MIIGAIVGIIIGSKAFSDCFWGFFIGIFFGFFVGMIMVLILSATIPESKLNIVEEHYLYIYNIEDNSNTTGNFCLGSGTIKEEMVYSFYVRTKYGYEPQTIPSNQCAIQETNKSPEIIERKYKFKNKKLNDWFIEPELTKPKFIILVPKGTIIRKFNLDSKY